VEMSDSVKTEKKYPTNPEDIEQEKEIVDKLKELKPVPLMLKSFAINHSLLKLKELEAEEQDEIAKKDALVNKEFQENLKHINDIINATRKPTDQELKDLAKYFTEEELAKKDELFAQIKPFEGYWLAAMRAHGLFKDVVTENDAKVLKSLTRVEYKMSEDAAHPLNFSLHFHFAANEYFDHDVLSVLLHVKEPRDCNKIDGTDIKWKEGKNITRKTVTKKQRNKKTGQTRNVTKEEDCDSFFKLFKSCEHEEHEHDHDEEDDDHDHEIFDHVEWAYSFFEEIIPYSLEYFLGVRKDFGGEGDDEDFEDEDDDGGSDDDEDDAPKRLKGGKGGKPKAAAPKTGGDDKKDQKECKQQ